MSFGRITKLTDERDRSEAEIAYAEIADELNDGSEHQLTIDDFIERYVALGSTWANEMGLPWPPQTGDFDRYAEARYYGV